MKKEQFFTSFYFFLLVALFCLFQLSRRGVNTVRDPVHLPHVLLHQEDAGQEEEIQSGCEGEFSDS